MNDQMRRLMEGAWDTHMHAMPGLTQSKNTILETAVMAKDLNMGGIVYKDLHFPTATQSSIVMEAVPGIKVVGGVSLNGSLGGLNPWVVEAAFKAKGKVVWMFTIDSAFTVQQILTPGFPMPKERYRAQLVDLDAGGYSVFKDGTEELRDEAREIIALCKQYDGVMETSHLSEKEAIAMIREGHNQGLKKMVLTHANQVFTLYSLDVQKAMIELGATISYCFEAYLSKPGMDGEPLGQLGQLIRSVGVENVVLGTDMGPAFWPSGIEGIRMMIGGLIADRFTEDEIARLVKTNPSGVYGS